MVAGVLNSCCTMLPGSYGHSILHLRALFSQATMESSMVVQPSKKLVLPKYCEHINQTKRRPTCTVEVGWRARNCGCGITSTVRLFCCGCRRSFVFLQIGSVKVGSEHPIALQTMTTTDTRDVAKTVEQVIWEPCPQVPDSLKHLFAEQHRLPTTGETVRRCWRRLGAHHSSGQEGGRGVHAHP